MSLKRTLALCSALVVVVAAAGLTWAVSAGVESRAPQAVGPDVTVFNLSDVGNYGGSGGLHGYSVGTRSCNRGDVPLNWCDQSTGCAPGATSADHPVIAQNLYRLKDGRFEQIGMSWLKHGFVSTNSTTAGCTGAQGQSCQGPPFGGNQLGVGCTDPYGSSLNGSRPLGPRSEVNAATGEYPFPHGGFGTTTHVSDQRIKVLESEIDTALNPGALFWIEGQYIAPDDAVASNGLNNASYRPVTVGASPTYTLSFSAATVEGVSAIAAWPIADPTVELINADIPSSSPAERFQVARQVTDLGGGSWHYEYAVRNHNSDRSAGSFSVQFSGPTTITNVGFRDIDHHSGEPYATTDWAADTAVPNTVTWSTDDFATDPNANAMRWATMFSFWFDADRAPSGGIQHTLGLFKPGSPASFDFFFSTAIFADGFETGDTTAWSQERP
jgi:hypothetical protein